ncbi:M48 family metallopeptidase [Halorussus halophilus]|uniref:M48 family metallopeptidase n=1 Tax=Halorussus halophilus TaxID=2650975 RepID=UPI0013016BD6|nr:M48 family metalloprotease [Halorussus halophilus]
MAGSSVTTGVLFVGAFAVLPAPLFYAVGALLRRNRRTATTQATGIRKARRFGYGLVLVSALTLSVIFSPFEPLSTALRPFLGDYAAGAETVAVLLGPVLLGTLGVYLGVFPHWQSVRDIDQSMRDAAKSFLKAALLFLLTVALTLTLVVAVPWPMQLVVATAALLAVPALMPAVVMLLADTRPLAETHPGLLADFETGDISVHVLEAKSAKVANALATGLPPWRHVFVSDYLLAELDAEQSRAILAHEFAHHQRYHIPVRIGGLFLYGTLWAGAVFLDVPYALWGGVLFLVPLLFGLFWVARRTERDADRIAAARTSPEAMASALWRLTELNLISGNRGGFASKRKNHPSTLRRVEALGVPPGPEKVAESETVVRPAKRPWVTGQQSPDSSWWLGVAVLPLQAALVAFLAAYNWTREPALSGLLVLLLGLLSGTLIVAPILTASLFFDARAVRDSDDEWDPSSYRYGAVGVLQFFAFAGGLVYLVTVPVSLYYLWKRGKLDWLATAHLRRVGEKIR